MLMRERKGTLGMHDDDFSWDSLGRYLRNEETPEERDRRIEREQEYAKHNEELLNEQMQREREGYTYGEDDLSLETQPPKPRDLSPDELKPPEPRR